MLSKSIIRLFGAPQTYGCRWFGQIGSPSSTRKTWRLAADAQMQAMSTTAAATKLTDDTPQQQQAKPFCEIPGPRGIPFVGNIQGLLKMMISNSIEDWHIHSMERFAKYGPIFKETIMGMDILYLADVDAVETVHRLDGKYPRRLISNSWKSWREESSLASGILISDGHDWKRMRTILDKQMLRPQHVAMFANTFNAVVTDFIVRLRQLRDKTGSARTISNFDHELFHWSLETIGTFLYEVRLGGLSDNRDPRMAKFIQSVQDLLTMTSKLNNLPRKVNRIIMRDAQKLHDDSWNYVFTITEYLVDEKLKKLKADAESGKESEPGFLSYLLSTDMSLEEIHANISELMLAAVDTSSNSVQWILYELARHEDIQKKLHKEVSSVVPLGKVPSYEDINKMPYLKAIVKEALRMYPVTGVSTRVLNVDMILCGYRVPAGVSVLSHTFQLGHDPKLYPEPEVFRPERWLRTDEGNHVHTFAWLPFGFGSRMCIGRRVAELEMHLLLARISQTFELKPDREKLASKYRGIIVPERSINVEFIDRPSP